MILWVSCLPIVHTTCLFLSVFLSFASNFAFWDHIIHWAAKASRLAGNKKTGRRTECVPVGNVSVHRFGSCRLKTGSTCTSLNAGTARQTDRQTQTGRQADRQADRQTNRSDRQTDRQTDRPKDRQMLKNRHICRQAGMTEYRQTQQHTVHTKTARHSHTLRQIVTHAQQAAHRVMERAAPGVKDVAICIVVVQVLGDDSLGHGVTVGLRCTGPQHSSHKAEEGQCRHGSLQAMHDHHAFIHFDYTFIWVESLGSAKRQTRKLQ